MDAGIHQAMGGTEGWRRLSEAFYARVARDPQLRPLFPGKSMRCAIEAFTAFLVQFFDGPVADSQFRWWLSLRESHGRFAIGPKERTAWMKNMTAALDEAEVPEPLRAALHDFFAQSSAYVIGQPSGPVCPEIAASWDAQRTLDDAVAAIRAGDTDLAIALAGALRNRATFVGLLARMIRSRQNALQRFVLEEVAVRPGLAHERYAGRTLLHEAASHGDLPAIDLLLRLGADPNTEDDGGHTPLYAAANECGFAEGPGVVRALVRAGALVDAGGGVTRATPLHMAARRDHVRIAQALLDAGAALEARDSSGDTPLRRAVNCNQSEVAALLIAAGADVRSAGSKGLTPLRAARSAAMKKLLASASGS